MASANNDQDATGTGSVFESSLPVEAKLEKARTELLDLSARNRLLNMPRSAKSARILQVANEHSAAIFRILVRENKPMAFLPGRGPVDASPDSVDGESGEIAEMAQPEDETRGGRVCLYRNRRRISGASAGYDRRGLVVTQRGRSPSGVTTRPRRRKIQAARAIGMMLPK